MPVICAFGAFLPPRRLTNDALAAKLGVTAAWILEASGIEERRIAEAESVADLAVAAGQDCLKNSGFSAAELGLIIVSSASSERTFPGPAAEVANRLGAAGIPALDVPVASAGSLFGLALADQLAPRYGTTLVVAAEKMSPHALAEPLDKNVAILFGDGAGACLVMPEDESGSSGLAILYHVLHSDGSFAEALKLEPPAPVKMNGLQVIMQASRKLPGVIQEVLSAERTTPAAVHTFLLHQANRNLIEKVAKSLGVEASRFYTNIQRYGNTSSASMLVAAAEWHGHAQLSPGDSICFAAFGAGFHWGALLAVQRTGPGLEHI
jgi:3-oxoacyl-[acyl-carrier-protein] synthase-3